MVYDKSASAYKQLSEIDDINEKRNEVYTVQKTSSKKFSEYALVPAAFLVQFVLLGFLNNIGAIKYQWDNSNIKKGILLEQTGSVNFGTLYISAILGFYVIEYLGPAATYSFGALFTSISLIIISNYPNQWTIFIFYGIVLGIGVSFILFSILCVIKEVHLDNLSAVNGIISSGTCLGTLVQAIYFDKLCRQHGWVAAFRFYSIVVLVLLLMGVLIQHVYSPRRQKKVQDHSHHTSQLMIAASVAKNKKFVILSISNVIFCLGYLTIFLYIQSFAHSRGLDTAQSKLLIGYYSIGSLFGRLIFGFFANYIGLLRVKALMINFFMMSILYFISVFCFTISSFLTFCTILGVFDGGVAVLTFPVICDMFATTEKGTVQDNEVQVIDRGKQENMATAISYLTQGISLMIGPLITNFLISTGYEISTTFLFASIIMAISSATLGFMHFV